jgi:hypothetical protein
LPRHARFTGLRLGTALLGANRGKTALRDAQRELSFIPVTPPHRHGPLCRDLLDQALAQQLADHLPGCGAPEAGANFNRTILAL